MSASSVGMNQDLAALAAVAALAATVRDCSVRLRTRWLFRPNTPVIASATSGGTCTGPVRAWKSPRFRMGVVEQRDAEGFADIGNGAGKAHPGRDALLVGNDEVVGLGKGLDRRDRFFIRAIFARELIAGHVGAVAWKLVVETGQVRQLLAAANADGEFDPPLFAGAAHRFRSGRQLMDAIGARLYY